MKILLVDDHASFCEGLIAAIATRKAGYKIDFESNAELVPKSLLGSIDYDLLVVDLMMPGIGGIELIRYLNKNRDATPIMVMSSVQDSARIREVFDLGIVGYIPKAYDVDQVIHAIEECQTGKRHLPTFVADILGESSDKKAVTEAGGFKLTRRQIEILSLIDQGLDNHQIGEALHVSRATVKTHINRIFRELGVSDRVNALRIAKSAGLFFSS